MRVIVKRCGRRQQQTDGPSTGRPETRVSGMRARSLWKRIIWRMILYTRCGYRIVMYLRYYNIIIVIIMNEPGCHRRRPDHVLQDISSWGRRRSRYTLNSWKSCA